MSWTEDRVARAKKLWLEGQSALQIAADLGGGLSRNAVIGKLTRMGLARNGASVPTSVKPVKAPKAPKALAKTRRPIPLPATTAYGWRPGPASEVKAPDLATVRKAEAAPVEPGLLKTFAEKGVDECSWPIGAPDPVRGQLFCGQRTAFRKSYCPCHGGPQAPQRRAYRVKDLGLAAERPIARPLSTEADVIDLVEAFR